jgi:calmodulin
MSQDRILKEAEEAFSFFQPPRTSVTRARNMLNTQNLEVALRSLGLRPPSVRDWDEYAQVRETQAERFQYVNEQGKGQLDWEDFRFIVEHRLAHRDTPADLLQAFKVFDPAGSGRVPTAEMKKVLTALGNKLTTAEINEMITEVCACVRTRVCACVCVCVRVGEWETLFFLSVGNFWATTSGGMGCLAGRSETNSDTGRGRMVAERASV